MPPRRGTKTRTRTAPATATATTLMTDAAIRILIAQGVADALAEQEIQRNTNLNCDGSQSSRSGITRLVCPTRECTYSDFLKCQPLNFKGTKGVEGIARSDRREPIQVAYLQCLSWIALVASNSIGDLADHLEKRILYSGPYALFAMEVSSQFSWIVTIDRENASSFCEGILRCRTLMCERMFLEESDEVEKYVGGLPDMIQGSGMAFKRKTMQEAIEIANDLIDQKKQSVSIAYTDGSGERKEYNGTLPLCNRCKQHHNGPCTVKWWYCKKVGHMTRDCRNPAATSNQRTITCYECGNQGHYKSDCPKLENQNHGNQDEGIEARGMVYALGEGETNQDLDDMEDDINA
ncbi:hypothetical protein Tco_0514544 [Tanacetum coccineum]